MGVRIRPRLRVLTNGVKDTPSIKNVSDTHIFDETSNWTLASTYTNTLRFVLVGTFPQALFLNNIANITSNNFVSGTNAILDIEQIVLRSDLGISINVLKTKLGALSVAGFKTWLGLNPTTLNYQLATTKNILSDRIY